MSELPPQCKHRYEPTQDQIAAEAAAIKAANMAQMAAGNMKRESKFPEQSKVGNSLWRCVDSGKMWNGLNTGGGEL